MSWSSHRQKHFSEGILKSGWSGFGFLCSFYFVMFFFPSLYGFSFINQSAPVVSFTVKLKLHPGCIVSCKNAFNPSLWNRLRCLLSFFYQLPGVEKIMIKKTVVVFLLQLTPAYEPCFWLLLNPASFVSTVPLPFFLSLCLTLLFTTLVFFFLGFLLASLLGSDSFFTKISRHQCTA